MKTQLYFVKKLFLTAVFFAVTFSVVFAEDPEYLDVIQEDVLREDIIPVIENALPIQELPEINLDFDDPEYDDESAYPKPEPTREVFLNGAKRKAFAPVKFLNNLLGLRLISKPVVLDKKPTHFCSGSQFSVNMKNTNQKDITLSFSGERGGGFVEIGNTPNGIDMKVIGQNGYIYDVTYSNQIGLRITKESGAQKGSFSVPIIYRLDKGVGLESTSICQINIINL